MRLPPLEILTLALSLTALNANAQMPIQPAGSSAKICSMNCLENGQRMAMSGGRKFRWTCGKPRMVNSCLSSRHRIRHRAAPRMPNRWTQPA